MNDQHTEQDEELFKERLTISDNGCNDLLKKSPSPFVNPLNWSLESMDSRAKLVTDRTFLVLLDVTFKFSTIYSLKLFRLRFIVSLFISKAATEDEESAALIYEKSTSICFEVYIHVGICIKRVNG